MRLLFPVLLCFVTVHALIPVNTFHRAFRRAGIDTHDIPLKTIQKFHRSIENAKSMKDLDKADKEFLNELSPVQRKKFGRAGWVKVFSGIVSLVIKLQNALTSIFKSSGYLIWSANQTYSNIRNGWQRSIVANDGDFEKVHRHLKQIIIKELSPYLTKDELNHLKQKMEEGDQKQRKVLRMAFALTRKETPARSQRRPQQRAKATPKTVLPKHTKQTED